MFGPPLARILCAYCLALEMVIWSASTSPSFHLDSSVLKGMMLKRSLGLRSDKMAVIALCSCWIFKPSIKPETSGTKMMSLGSV